MVPTIDLLVLRILVHLQALPHGIEEAHGKEAYFQTWQAQGPQQGNV
jgi:hypothetical protein